MEPRRRPQNHSYEKHHKSHHLFRNSRTPSPAKKGMRHTMRKEPSSSDSEDEGPYQKHKKKRLMRKHPNKHHEGDRKRWRDAITERERKRYEGVWAANRGLHVVLEEVNLQTPAVANTVNEQVCSLVVRDIWSRSRLPEHVLEEVWGLVDTQGVGRLSKEEFVVGMWLIDQCLKGRKLPIKVSDSVWGSVRTVGGIKVRRK
ncbi:hypothetical protein B0A49_13825 [Cryomyces minteri]|uniref:EH domain-containing protein n=2 Tax=Cryomyces minteri TaxID=331657 RepID=A0A4U0V4I7_9PEZI|nr:hypothetical protein B0A49_13833 [Cryomyces minteri]TKA43224.1 hypothetical protein B0A49_13825 [Cryomyces minteri]